MQHMNPILTQGPSISSAHLPTQRTDVSLLESLQTTATSASPRLATQRLKEVQPIKSFQVSNMLFPEIKSPIMSSQSPSQTPAKTHYSPPCPPRAPRTFSRHP